MELLDARGRLMAIGGGEDKENDCLILKEFVRLAGGAKANIAVITTATDLPAEVGNEYHEVFKKLGAKETFAVQVATRSDAMQLQCCKLIEKASGIFFTGGDQLHITSLMGGTELQKAILKSYENGVIVAGTSAGAAVMGNSMIISGESDENPRMGGVEIAAGTDFIVGCIIDTHFSQRGRHGRLLAAVAHHPQDVGFGIDENTAMVVDKHKFKVIGEGSVTVIDGSMMSYSDIPYVTRGQSIALADVKIHVIPNDYEFHLTKRQMIVPKRPKQKAKAANESGKKNKSKG
ncbi:MAG: cyanophycinase [Pyrinomonadaceae bacterium]|nr:cyanophycinase [Pyrinomonadaceae bacterium]